MDLKDFDEKFITTYDGEYGNNPSGLVSGLKEDISPAELKSYFISKYKEALERLRADALKEVQARHGFLLSPSEQMDFQVDLASELVDQLDAELKGLKE